MLTVRVLCVQPRVDKCSASPAAVARWQWWLRPGSRAGTAEGVGLFGQCFLPSHSSSIPNNGWQAKYYPSDPE